MEISKKEILVNSSYNFLGKLLPLVVAVIVIPILIDRMGTERFGILTLTWAVIGYFSFFDLGVGRATTKFVAEYLARKQTEELPNLIWSSLFLLTGFGVLAGLVGWSLSSWLVEQVLNIEPSLREESRQTLIILMACLPFVFATAGMQGVLEAQQRFGLINIFRSPLFLANYLGPLLVLPFAVSLVPVVTLLALARLLVCGIFFVLIKWSLPGMTFPSLPKPFYIKKLLFFGGWLSVSNIFLSTMAYMDRFLIGSWLSMSAVAYYVTPFEMITRLLVLPDSFMPVLFPIFSSLAIKDKNKIRLLFNRGVKFIFIIFVPLIITVIIFAYHLIDFWVGLQFAEISTPVLKVLSIGVLMNCLTRFPNQVIQALDRPDITAKLHLYQFPVYLALLWMLIKPLGITGVALSWTIWRFLESTLAFLFAQRIIPQRERWLTAHNIYTFLFLIGYFAVVFLLSIVSSAIIKISLFPIILICFILIAWRVILDNEDRNYAITFFRKFNHNLSS